MEVNPCLLHDDFGAIFEDLEQPKEVVLVKEEVLS